VFYSAKTIVDLKEFIQMYVAAHDRAMEAPVEERTIRRIKVCIIDTGIDESRFKLETGKAVRPQVNSWAQRKAQEKRAKQQAQAVADESTEDGSKSKFVGATFSQTGNSHWWLSADSHGTQMAKLVTNLDPCCTVYVAKVGDSKSNITNGAVVSVSLTPTVDIFVLMYYGPRLWNGLSKKRLMLYP
jgi:hypothetical protein